MKQTPLIFLAALSATAAAAIAETTSWSCRNTDAEIRCDGDGCEVLVGDGFTPMHVSAATDATLSFCAYTGCWEGMAETMTRTGGNISWTGTDLRWNHAPDDAGVTGSLTIDTESKVGTVLIAGFAQPVLCE